MSLPKPFSLRPSHAIYTQDPGADLCQNDWVAGGLMSQNTGNNITFLPVLGQSLPEAMAFRHSLFQLRIKRFEQVIVEWPWHWNQTTCEDIVRACPEYLVLEDGDTSTHISAVDSYRLLLKHIFTDHGKTKIVPAAPQYPFPSFPLMQPSGSLLFGAMATVKPVPEQPIPLKSYDRNLKTLVLGSFSFCQRVEESLQDPDQVAAVPLLGRKSQPKINLTTGKSATEHGHYPGFFIKDFYNRESQQWPWDEFWTTSFHNALKRAEERYTERTRMPVSQSLKYQMARFLKRLTLKNHHQTPTSFDILLAAQSCIDSNFSYELLQECTLFPTSPMESRWERKEYPISDLEGNPHTITISRFSTVDGLRKHFKPRLKSLKKKHDALKKDQATAVDETKYSDPSWVDQPDLAICSYPSEDLFLEDDLFSLRKNMKERIKTSETITRPLETNLYDGVDVRETIRNWHNKTLMVKDIQKTGKEDIGSIVVNFAPQNSENFSWKGHFFAEEHDNTDIIFSATPYQEGIIGPGIAQCEYGAFALVPVPNFLGYSWGEPYLRSLGLTTEEFLILCGAIGTHHKAVLYVSDTPPSQQILGLVRRSGKAVVHTRLSELSPNRIRRLKTFHILAEHGVRAYADKYILKD